MCSIFGVFDIKTDAVELRKKALELSRLMRHRGDAPRDKCAHFREINGIAAAFQYSQKNYIPTALSFL